MTKLLLHEAQPEHITVRWQWRDHEQANGNDLSSLDLEKHSWFDRWTVASLAAVKYVHIVTAADNIDRHKGATRHVSCCPCITQRADHLKNSIAPDL